MSSYMQSKGRSVVFMFYYGHRCCSATFKFLTRTASSGNITDRLHWNATISSSSSSKSLKYHHLLLSPIFLLLKVDPPCNLEDILVGERTIWIEVVAASSFQPSHQLAHVSRKAVLGGSSCQPAAPEKMFAGVTSGAKALTHPTREIRFLSLSEMCSLDSSECS